MRYTSLLVRYAWSSIPSLWRWVAHRPFSTLKSKSNCTAFQHITTNGRGVQEHIHLRQRLEDKVPLREVRSEDARVRRRVRARAARVRMRAVPMTSPALLIAAQVQMRKQGGRVARRARRSRERLAGCRATHLLAGRPCLFLRLLLLVANPANVQTSTALPADSRFDVVITPAHAADKARTARVARAQLLAVEVPNRGEEMRLAREVDKRAVRP